MKKKDNLPGWVALVGVSGLWLQALGTTSVPLGLIYFGLTGDSIIAPGRFAAISGGILGLGLILFIIAWVITEGWED